MSTRASISGVPPASELLKAVADFLRDELVALVPPDRRYEVLVAANVCAIAQREIEAGDAPARSDVELFSEILGVQSAAGDASDPATEATALAENLQAR